MFSLSTVPFLKNIFGGLSKTKPINFENFDLISKIPLDPHYNQTNFFQDVYLYKSKPTGLYFNKEIECADDIVYNASQISYEKNAVEYRAMGFADRLKEAIMQSSLNPSSKFAKYIIFTTAAMQLKYGNPIIGVLVNNHKDADPNVTLEYDIYREKN